MYIYIKTFLARSEPGPSTVTRASYHQTSGTHFEIFCTYIYLIHIGRFDKNLKNEKKSCSEGQNLGHEVETHTCLTLRQHTFYNCTLPIIIYIVLIVIIIIILLIIIIIRLSVFGFFFQSSRVFWYFYRHGVFWSFLGFGSVSVVIIY